MGEEATLRDSQQFSASAIPSSEGQRRVNLQTIPTDQNTEIIKKALLEWLSAIKAAVAIAANKIANGTGGKPLEPLGIPPRAGDAGKAELLNRTHSPTSEKKPQEDRNATQESEACQRADQCAVPTAKEMGQPSNGEIESAEERNKSAQTIG